MQIAIDSKVLSRYKLMVCTPCFAGQMGMLYTLSCLKLQQELLKHSIRHTFNFLQGESLIPRARNRMADMFMASNCSHLLFLDADISFNEVDVVHMLALDYDILCGPYPKKAIDWKHVIQAKNEDQAKAFAGQFVLNLMPGTKEFKLDEPIEVLESGTGFMMIARRVFEKMQAAKILETYVPIEGEKALTGPVVWDYFNPYIDKETRTYLSEDYAFCRRWRSIGGRIFLCPWFRTVHSGTMDFTGDIPGISAAGGTL